MYAWYISLYINMNICFRSMVMLCVFIRRYVTNLPKTVLYFCERTVLKVLCYQNIYAEKTW